MMIIDYNKQLRETADVKKAVSTDEQAIFKSMFSTMASKKEEKTAVVKKAQQADFSNLFVAQD